ncbi:MAG TPA: DinB family protein [Gemmatales bacterium]|nr:DinB family protein [Gemmatales bacterium]HMP61380.1 DinB family protein [Gemmatales bacterium]
MEEQLIETWNIHDRIHRYLLKAIPPAGLSAGLGPKHRTVYQLFAHIHHVRLMWLKASAPELLAGLAKIEGTSGNKADLAKNLEASGQAVAQLLRQSLASGGKVKGFKPHAVAFLGYLISHESHHRGQIGWTLKNSGHPLDQKTAYGLWEWGVR